jgi:DNA polymerase-3 subunit alpha
VETRLIEKPEEPVIIRLNLDHEKMRVLEDLYRLAQQNPGRKPLKLLLCSKLQEVEIDSAIHVNEEMLRKLGEMEEVEVLASA